MNAGGDLPFSEKRVAFLAWAFDDSPDLVVAADVRGVLTFANRVASERLPSAKPGARLVDLFPGDAGASLRAALARGEPARFEWGDATGGRVRSWWFASLTPLNNAAGELEGHLLVSSDATEMKRTEARLRRSEELMVDTQGTAHLGTWEWDVSEPHATWSAELFRIYGLSPDRYTPSYERYLEMVHPDDRQRVIDATNRVFHEHIPYSHDERIFRPDGSIRYLHTWAHPVLDDDGKLTKLVGVCQDITDRWLAEDEVRRLNVDLERRVHERTRTIESSMRDLESFNAMVSHDLRAPLSVIHLSCSVIRASGASALPSNVIDNLSRIERSVVHMSRLISDLLTLAHVGSSALAVLDVDVSSIAEEILEDLRRAAPERDVATSIEPGLLLHGDPTLLRTVLANLLGNAWKYSSRVSAARIDVGSVGTERGRAIFVRDNGVGFDMSDADKLFEPFRRLHSPTEFEGTGVGLAAVRRIVDRHGGRVWAESAPGRGATFFVELLRPDNAPH